jgi:anti-anti-sigma factor
MAPKERPAHKEHPDHKRIGTTIASRYAIERLLARGGMGCVYVARDEKFGVRVALKVSAASGDDYAGFKARVVREARIGNRLGKAKGFVRAFDWGEIEGPALFLAMDLVPGARGLDLDTGTLAERISRLEQAARLVARAHDEGVIHRDVKPPNFLQDDGGTIWLADFGLAKVADDDGAADRGAAAKLGEEEVTQTGGTMGTPQFMSPEHFSDVKTVDERADVYALGVMLHMALTKKMPFDGSPVAIAKKQQRMKKGLEPLPRARDLRADAPAELDALCAEAMALDRDHRTKSAAALADALLAFVRGVPAGSDREITLDDSDEGTVDEFVPTAEDLTRARRLPDRWTGASVGAATLKFVQERHGEVVADVLRVSGHVRAPEALDLASYVVSLLMRCESLLALDLSRVRFMGSAGLGALVRAQDAARSKGKRLYLLPMPAHAEQTFRTLGLQSFIPRTVTVAEAARDFLDSLKKPSAPSAET